MLDGAACCVLQSANMMKWKGVGGRKQTRKDKRKEEKQQEQTDRDKRETKQNQPLETSTSGRRRVFASGAIPPLRSLSASLVPSGFARSHAIISTICIRLFVLLDGHLQVLCLERDHLASGVLHEEVDYGVEVGLLLGRDAVAADLTALDGLKVELLDQLVYSQFLLEV